MTYDGQIEPIDNSCYYRRRAAEEALRAEAAKNPVAEQAHRNLAALLARKAAEINGPEEVPPSALTVQPRSKVETLAQAFDGANDLPLPRFATGSGEPELSEINHG